MSYIYLKYTKNQMFTFNSKNSIYSIMANTPSESSSITFQNNLPARPLGLPEFIVSFSVNGVRQCYLKIGEQKTIFLEAEKHLFQAEIDYSSDTQALFLELESSKNSLLSLEAEKADSWIDYFIYRSFYRFPKYSSKLILKKVRSNNILSHSDRLNGTVKKPGENPSEHKICCKTVKIKIASSQKKKA